MGGKEEGARISAVYSNNNSNGKEDSDGTEKQDHIENPIERDHRVKKRSTFLSLSHSASLGQFHSESVSYPQVESIKWECDGVRLYEANTEAGYTTNLEVISVKFKEN